MANVKYNRRMVSPFFSRNYGGYSNDQVLFYEKWISKSNPKTIFDPMSGQGYLLSKQVYSGRSIILGDLNPVAIMLASLRNPEYCSRSEFLYHEANKFLDMFEAEKCFENSKNSYCDEIVSEPTKNFLLNYRARLLDEYHSDVTLDNRFWSLPLIYRFLLTLPILSSRRITNFRKSDNSTWLMSGSLIRFDNPLVEMRRSLLDWYQFAQSLDYTAHSLTTLFFNATSENDYISLEDPFDQIITSPPYANRLDYSRYWLPELTVLSYISEFKVDKYKRDVIGSNIVSKKKVKNTELLNKQTIEELELIKQDGNHGSSSYYYPYFRNYATELSYSLKLMHQYLADSGKIILFIRDTRRKDVLLSTKNIVDHVLSEMLGCELLDFSLKVIRNHPGKKQSKKNQTSLIGDAQREWWLVYEK